jgi:BirA family biotin operon repressor/biotin-[acetyl-CoA-carboxylase] ligase
MFNPIEITQFLGKTVWYLPTCTSTNDMAKNHADNHDLLEGTIIITSHQTAGRGQRGNTWQTVPNQNLTFSLLLNPSFLQIHEQFWLNIAVTLGITDALLAVLPSTLIKWSNDIYNNNKKLGGILIENILQQRSIKQSIVGIGLNINQLDFDLPTATSLALATQKTWDLPTLLSSIILHIEKRYLQLRQQNPLTRQQLKETYLERLYGYQENRQFIRNGELFEGRIIGVSPEGYLGISIANQQTTQFFDIKEISFVHESF